MEHKLEKYNMSYSKYTNWPSCDSTDWMTRYWGENYNRLLAIKVTHLLVFHMELILVCRNTGTRRTSSITARVLGVLIICAVPSHSGDLRDKQNIAVINYFYLAMMMDDFSFIYSDYSDYTTKGILIIKSTSVKQ